MMQRTVTDIKRATQKKMLVYINCEPAFPLYNEEVDDYGLREGEDVADDVYEDIIAMLTKRAVIRAASLIKDRDYTEYEMRGKLSAGYYPQQVIDDVVEYLINNRYIDDVRYAYNYFCFRSDREGMSLIVYRLKQKGISLEDLESAYDNFHQDKNDSEHDSLVKCMKKKLKGRQISGLSYEEKQKLLDFVCRKGYSYDGAVKAFNELLDNEEN